MKESIQPPQDDPDSAQRERRLEALSRIADGVAHDFTNVLAVILAYADFIKEASPFDDGRREDAHQILLAAGAGTALIRQLLAIAGHETEEKPIDLNNSLAQMHGLLARSLAEHSELDVVPSPSPVVVRIDPVRFDQVVMGLSINACDATRPGGKVRITLERVPDVAATRGAVARMTVAGSYAGSGGEAHQVVFEPAAGSERDGPQALELEGCLRSVEDAGGSISICVDEGRGSCFTVDLPICDESSSRAEFDFEHSGDGKHVLIAEGDPGLRHAAARAFARAGYEVSLAATRDQAREQLVALGARLDVLVADAALQGTGQHDLSPLARSVSAQPVLLLTRVILEGDGARAPIPGVRTLYKPLLPMELVQAASEGLAARATPTPSKEAEKKLVLVVEDDDSVRTALERLLNYAGYSTQLASTLAAARSALESGPEPSFVLCDLTLPDGSSVELLKSIAQERPALSQRVLVLSGGAIEDADVVFARSGAFPVLLKPIDAAALLRILERSVPR